MGYDTHINGHLTVTPALSQDRLNRIFSRASKAIGDDAKDYLEAIEEGEEDELVIDDKGGISVKEGDRHTLLSFPGDEPLRSGGLEFFTKTVVAVVSEIQVSKGVTPHVITDEFMLYGEEQGDITRLAVVNGKVVNERPQLLWPDGSTSELP